MQDTRTAIGFSKQTDLVTPVLAAELWSLRQTNRTIPYPTLNTENDQDWIGKGVWITQIFPTSWDVNYTWEARLTSENVAQVVAFALGKVVEAAPLYTITPLDNVVDCFEDLPSTTIVSNLEECSCDVLDMSLIGMVCEEFTIALNSGPGLDNATISSNWVGTGKFIQPSGLAIPAFTTEHSLRAGGALVTIMGTNYITTRRFVSCNIGYKNNVKLDQGFYRGSGIQNNASIRGRMRRGSPQGTLNFVVEMACGSDEFTKFINQTEGTAIIECYGQTIGAGPAKHGFKATFHRIVYSAETIGENDNTVTLNVEAAVMQDPATGKVMTWEVTTEKPGIGSTSTAASLLPPEELAAREAQQKKTEEKKAA